MRLDKVVLRAFLSTVAAIATLVLFMIFALCTIYPATMMQITYDLGLDKLAIANAKQAYKRTGDVYYIAFATETAIGIDDLQQIDVCGSMLIVNDGFDGYCEKRNTALALDESTGTYDQYVYGQVCVAKYNRGNKSDAVDKAFDWVGNDCFPQNNAIVAVLMTALIAEDTATVDLVEEKLLTMQTSDFSPLEQTYYNTWLGYAQE